MYVDITPFFEPGDRLTGHATATVAEGRFGRLQSRQAGGSPGLSANGNGGNYLTQYPAAGAKPDGVYAKGGNANDKVLLLCVGSGMIVPVMTGAVVSDGQEVMVDAQGRAIPYDPATATNRIAGKAIVGAASGGFAEVRIY